MNRAKLTWYFSLTVCAFLCIIARLSYLQMYKNSTFFNLSQKNFLRHEKIVSPRGNIYDRHGKLLATNKPIVSLYWQGSGNKKLSTQQRDLLTYLSEKLGMRFDNLPELEAAEHLNQQYLLEHDIDFEKLSLLIEQFPHHANLVYTTHFKRFYPHAASASHVLGYIGGLSLETSGVMGLEKICNELLKGEPGEQTRTVNSRGKNLAYEHIKQALSGDDIHTTLDLQLSQIACDVFPEDTNGCMLIMDSDTGNLHVILSRPTFDPNIFLDPLSTESWQQLQVAQPFLNRASNACYPPASLFKLISMAAGLETGIIDQSDVWMCHGHVTFAGRDYHCSQRKGHGPVTTVSAIARSCNIPFFEIGKKIKIDTLADYAHRLGLGSPTHSLLPEKSGLIPTRKWKRETKGEAWWPGETLSAAIGQSALLVTPLQIARMFNGIFHGSLVRPRLLESEPIESQPVDLSESTRDFLKRAMKKTIEDHGTGVRLKRLKDITIYAKTGTAQVSAWEKRELGPEHLEHAWFAAHVTYKDRPPFVMILLLEHVGSSSVATNIALKYLRAYMKLSPLPTSPEAV